MTEISSTDAARSFADMLDAVEHRGEDFTIVRRGKAIAHLEPISSGRGADVRKVLLSRPADPAWGEELAAIRELVQIQHRQ